MSLNARNVPSSGGDFERPDPLDPGTYPARLAQIATLGVQKQRPYKGEDKPPKLEILLTYELLDEFMPDEDGEPDEERPRWLSEKIPFNNLDADLAKSTKRYMALDPGVVHDGDWGALVGTPCMLTIVVNEGKGKNAGKFYENISNVSAMRAKEAAKAPELVSEALVFDFYEPDMEVYAKLPKWIKTVMTEAVDYEGGPLADAVADLPAEGEDPKPKAKAGAKKAVKPKADAEADPELEDEIPW